VGGGNGMVDKGGKGGGEVVMGYVGCREVLRVVVCRVVGMLYGA